MGFKKDEILMSSASRFGMDALFRDAKGDRLNDSSVEDASIRLYSKLAIYPMPTSTRLNIVENTLMETYEDIVEAVDKCNDFVFVDARGGASALNQKVLASADVLVICLNQNIGTIDTYFTKFNLQSRRVFTLIGNYDRQQSVSMKNVRKRYKTLKSANSAVIPHCSGFSDAMNEGKLLHWMSVNKECDKNDVNYPFIKEVGLASKKIVTMCSAPKGGAKK
jgi:MinD-like ATPase involved in chromosome partitioning or flagellar assembly